MEGKSLDTIRLDFVNSFCPRNNKHRLYDTLALMAQQLGLGKGCCCCCQAAILSLQERTRERTTPLTQNQVDCDRSPERISLVLNLLSFLFELQTKGFYSCRSVLYSARLGRARSSLSGRRCYLFCSRRLSRHYVGRVKGLLDCNGRENTNGTPPKTRTNILPPSTRHLDPSGVVGSLELFLP